MAGTLALLAILSALHAQPQQQAVPAGSASGQILPQPLDAERLRPNYVLHPGDQIQIRAFEMDDVSERPLRIDGDGYLDLPTLGRVKAAGLNLDTLQATLVELAKKYVRVPQIYITVIQYTSEPIYFVGAFKSPGIYSLSGKQTLVELMSANGGLDPTASRRIKVTRRKESGALPLPTAVVSPDGNTSSVEINMASLRDNLTPAEDIVLQPFDVVSVERAEMVYVAGEVGHVGGFDLRERDSISVIQALTLAGGLSASAKPKTASILRPVSNSSQRFEIPLNLDRILKGLEADRPLLPNDVLYIPKASGVKHSLGRTLLIVLPIIGSITGILVATTR